ncbi:MAG: hypothetical protein JWM38_629 [Sphingomonas bacterium]|jgi:hypothetical protein|nr:hypothetical protein [Sphingomonas bacterium]MDB5684731.1 hypothetical protein [Sphingomonas bacterium]MDB5717202.1 hypothetical protein [Sphingomonas bacterium]
MQRVRIGLTGLACVFLLVLLAAAFFGLARREPDVDPASSNLAAPNQSDAITAEAPKEPLAELGVTPGNLPLTDQPDNVAPPPAAPQATPAP